jgi:hypothetical protein
MLLLYRLGLKESIENIAEVAARTGARTLLPPGPHWLPVSLGARGIWQFHEDTLAAKPWNGFTTFTPS